MPGIEFRNKLIVGPSPHIGTADDISRIMWSVAISLIPALIAALIFFGWYALLVVAVSVASAVVTEIVAEKIRGVPITVSDGSAVVTGMLLAYVIPPNVPLYVPAIGSAFAIGIAKHAFGGLGCNIWNPALMGRAFLLAAYSGFIVMTKWPILKNFVTGNVAGVDAITRATPCAVLKNTPLTFFQNYSYTDLFLGRHAGSLGETSTLALLIGAIYLMVKKYVNWRLPVAYVITVMALVLILPIPDGHGGTMALWKGGMWAHPLPILKLSLAHALSGGLIIGAFFMATDMVTSPLTSKGQVIFGVGCGALVAIIRLYGGYPEGVCYSIILMNTAVWLIDRHTVPRFFGERRHGAKAA